MSVVEGHGCSFYLTWTPVCVFFLFSYFEVTCYADCFVNRNISYCGIQFSVFLTLQASNLRLTSVSDRCRAVAIVTQCFVDACGYWGSDLVSTELIFAGNEHPCYFIGTITSLLEMTKYTSKKMWSMFVCANLASTMLHCWPHPSDRCVLCLCAADFCMVCLLQGNGSYWITLRVWFPQTPGHAFLLALCWDG